MLRSWKRRVVGRTVPNQTEQEFRLCRKACEHMSAFQASESGQSRPPGLSGDNRQEIKPEVPTAAPMVMPASAERAARDIADIGVEGRPADAKSGPGMLRVEMLAMLGVLTIIAVLVGIFASWVLGGVMFVVGVLALVFNPVMGATAYREKDRREAVEREQGSSPAAGKNDRKGKLGN